MLVLRKLMVDLHRKLVAPLVTEGHALETVEVPRPSKEMLARGTY